MKTVPHVAVTQHAKIVAAGLLRALFAASLTASSLVMRVRRLASGSMATETTSGRVRCSKTTNGGPSR